MTSADYKAKAKAAKRKEQAAKKAARKNRPKRETSKVVLWFIVANGVAWIWCSYILAWFDHAQIAEELSKTALITIIGTFTPYLCKTVFENLSKHNIWPDRLPDPATDETGGPEE